MRTLGLDIGSRTVKLVLMKDGEVIFTHKCLNSYDPLTTVKEALADLDYDVMLATGYGRGLAQKAFNVPTVTEIKAFATGARHLEPRCRTILDIGGQDTKAIALNEQGKVVKFEMNDRCAAGTGRFLEVMAKALGYEIEEFGQAALAGDETIHISSMCTVFAETEVISLLARGEKRENIARALHLAIVKRAVAMLNRVGVQKTLVFAGGVAHNPCMCFLLERMLSIPVTLPYDPQLVGAYGAAILAKEGTNEG
ncbi:MAG: 3-hydroxyacyl-ACP dehydratase [Candidatus Desulfofervidaceae bacterium]|nr:3-hydroxyacyl-ACP dehydratase [Candidatus Desulfofervidaceae bacterium]MDL1971430.1 acyl-CoA dehydratase activase [Candidatus Desulfofervidaceae bacterium]